MKLTMITARQQYRQMINSAISKPQAAKAIIRLALSCLSGRDDTGCVWMSSTGRGKLAETADARIDTMITSSDVNKIYTLSTIRHADTALAVAREFGIILF